jgi:hypothetical protein
MPILAILLGTFIVVAYILINKSIKKRAYEEAQEELNEEDIIEVVGEKPVKIELLPYGTKCKPVLCKKNEHVFFTVIGWVDHKMTKKADLKFTDITWHKSCPVGRFENAYGVTNTYIAPDAMGYRTIWVRHVPTGISAKTKIKVEA